MRVLFLSLIVAGSVAAAPRPAVENLAATAAHGRVSVRFTLDGAFRNSEMVEALQSGLPTSFTYNIEIYRDRPRWFNEDVGRSRVEVICTFNSVTREYLLNYRRDRKLVRSETFTDLAALVRQMTTIDEPSLFDIGTHKPYKLRVRVKADLMRGWLMYVIPWEISTHWRDVRVKESPSSALRAPSPRARGEGLSMEMCRECRSEVWLSARARRESPSPRVSGERVAEGRVRGRPVRSQP
jgi:hypothetical protein